MASIKQFGERKDNISAIVSFIRRNEATTRMEICKALHLSWACVSDLVADLIKDDVLIESAPSANNASSAKGRSPAQLSLNENKYFLGVDINNFGIAVTSLSINGVQIAFKKWEAKHFTDEKELTLSVCDHISEMLSCKEDCCGIGVAVEGMRSEDGGFLYPMKNGCVSVFPQREIAARFELPVSAKHDPECMLYSVAKPYSEDCIMVRADTEEIGIAAMKHGKILELPLELGHTCYGGLRLRDILHSCAEKGDFCEIIEMLGYSVANLALLLGIQKCYLVGEWTNWLGKDMYSTFESAFKSVCSDAKFEICALADASDGAARLAMSEYPTIKSQNKKK